MVISIEVFLVWNHLTVMLHAFDWKFTQCMNVTLNLFFRYCTLGFLIFLLRRCTRWCLIQSDFIYSHFIHLQVFLHLNILSGASQSHSLWSYWLLRCTYISYNQIQRNCFILESTSFTCHVYKAHFKDTLFMS